ncbi:hypothetical protein CHISP_0421 [Chitinispirillum alkaliphilum]|nr:hypothetical protein CHISP_0421 [Chitinispirillum alkaliphilum]
MVYRVRFFISLFLITIFIGACSRRPLLNLDSAPSVLQSLDQLSPQITSFEGFGNITFSERGARQTGRLDASWDSSGKFEAYIYTPFGSTVASVKGDSFGGRVMADDEVFYFGIDDYMIILPFSWGRNVTFAQFIHYFTGRMPHTSVMSRDPDLLEVEGSNFRAVWRERRFNVSATISRRSEEIQSVQFDYNRGNDTGWTIRYRNFDKGLAREIAIEDDSRNYILIRYNEISAEQVPQ